MKRLMLLFLIGAFVTTSSVARAGKKASLGVGNFAVKLDYIVFTDRHFDALGNQDDGLYIGVEGYGEITPNLYLGGEVGQAVNISVGGEEISFSPVELNLKYTIEAGSNSVADFGAGASYCYVELQYQPLFQPIREERRDWLLGGQFFADLTYRIQRFSIGVNAKYQITEDFEDEDLDLSNWKLGVQVGIIF